MPRTKELPPIESAEDMSAIEEADIAFDPTKQHLDLSVHQKRRTTALLLAIQAYDKLIIKDAEMYIAVSRDSGREGALKIRPATIHAIVEAAISFDMFINGAFDPKEQREPQPEPQPATSET